ncbi:MAG: ATP-dependent DNA helicase [Caldilineaceae bacterium]|nr:ATP-dependent DNA helicase [Caldilineaceae bacterium]
MSPRSSAPANADASHERQSHTDDLVYEELEGPYYPLAEDDGPEYANKNPSQTSAELEAIELSDFFGAGGPLAQKLEGYESRPSQLAMAEAVKRAVLAGKHALIEAPTGTGKSIAYLIPAILSGKTIVVATANKSLQSQLFMQDIPFLRTVLNKPIDAVVVKGRSNFVCTYKWEKEEPIQNRLAFYDRENDQVAYLKRWLKRTETGDVDDLPFMLASDLRPKVVSYTDDCLQRDCPYFHDNCWVNHMRDQAAQAQVIVTNHHLLLNALELGMAGQRILPPADIYIVDEAHQLEDTATAIFETTVSDFTVEQALRRGQVSEFVAEDELDEIRFQNTLAFQSVANQERGNSFRLHNDLEEIGKLGRRMEQLGKQLRDKNPYHQIDEDDDELTAKRRSYELTMEMVNSAANKLNVVAASHHDDEVVRYAVRIFDRRHVSLEIHAAPITPGALIARYLFHPVDEFDAEIPRTVICTSATLAADGRFDHFKQRCGIEQTGEEHILPAVFDYPSQALLYQPALPAFNFKHVEPYYDAIAQEVERLIEVSRGRALCLFTSWSGLQQVDHRLRQGDRPVIWPVRAQGDAPRDALLEWFKSTPHSVLLATRSFWEGVDIPGDDLSLVVMDKLPFPTPSDPLHAARMEQIDAMGEQSFGRYMLPLMTLALKQGFGRLIRRASDRGVVAILDARLSDKAYGRRARQDLPPARFSRTFGEVHRFFRQAGENEVDFALNVWGETDGEPGVAWRWQLLRLQDGKSDDDAGRLTGSDDPVAGELHAARVGLDNLAARVRKAGRTPDEFGIEVRCGTEWTPTGSSKAGAPENHAGAQWTDMAAAWRTAHLLVVKQE